jgi:hypothetical protein
VVFEGIQRGIRCGERLDVETVIKRAGPEFGQEKRRREPVVDLVGVGRIETLINAEEEKEDVFEPHPGGGSPEKMVVFCKKTPDFPGIGLDRASVRPGDTELFQRNSPAVEHPEDIMIRDQKQLRRVGKGDVVRIPPGIGVTVGADDGQIPDLAVQAVGDPPLGGIAGKKPILVHDEGSSHNAFLLSFIYDEKPLKNALTLSFPRMRESRRS